MTATFTIETVDQRADRLAEIAAQLAARVREDDPRAVARWLQAVVPAEDLPAFAIILACAVPDLPFRELTAWAWSTPVRQLAPCGTRTAAARHRSRGEEVDAECEAAEKLYYSDRYWAARGQRPPVREFQLAGAMA